MFTYKKLQPKQFKIYFYILNFNKYFYYLIGHSLY